MHNRAVRDSSNPKPRKRGRKPELGTPLLHHFKVCVQKHEHKAIVGAAYAAYLTLGRWAREAALEKLGWSWQAGLPPRRGVVLVIDSENPDEGMAFCEWDRGGDGIPRWGLRWSEAGGFGCFSDLTWPEGYRWRRLPTYAEVER